MYLEKLEIQGFKSFANKNVLVFPGMLDSTRRGLTAVVGPNGSGKSNVADAVRWALGEQSMKTLRGKKSEDVIFSGSDKKGKLGMAEVSLHLNNEDKQAPIDFSQIVLTRRLYRDGESEYILNGSRVRLSDMQMLLAKAKFGQKTYSVIGQGMVEGFLNTSLTERKEFFDEATGVKQFQIKRDDALNKLRNSYDNLVQANMLLVEIEPRLKSLTRQVGRLKRRGEIETELKALQLRYYRVLWHDLDTKFGEANGELLALEQEQWDRNKKLETLTRQLNEIEQSGRDDRGAAELQERLITAQAAREAVSRQLARLEAQLELKLEAAGDVDLSYLVGRKEELQKEISALAEETATQETRIREGEAVSTALNAERNRLEVSLRAVNEQLSAASQTAADLGQAEYAAHLDSALERLRHIQTVEDLDTVRTLVRELHDELSAALARGQGGAPRPDWGQLHTELTALTAEKEALLTKIGENTLRLTARRERARLLGEQADKLREQVVAITAKLGRQAGKLNGQDDTAERERLTAELALTDQALADARAALETRRNADAAERDKLFSLQRELQAVQQEANLIGNKLNERKVSAARYETRLEDLELEIRAELEGLQDVKLPSPEGAEPVDTAAAKEKITGLKHQLELIGGIDSQVESEYQTTKERFDFLSAQVGDFTSAVESLEEVIAELDKEIKERFDREFKVIAENFEKYFSVLFNGGAAKIIKVMAQEEADEQVAEGAEGAMAPSDPTAANTANASLAGLPDLKKIKFLQKHNATGLAGIEIQATPPGKKIKSIAMLSGGERALTAIALICAIINSNPSPFVVLDEVDAALDEANSERLAKILDELSHRTQFIVVTHNRASMRKASILYGVTMGDDGVSKLLSVKLEEAEAAKLATR